MANDFSMRTTHQFNGHAVIGCYCYVFVKQSQHCAINNYNIIVYYAIYDPSAKVVKIIDGIW